MPTKTKNNKISEKKTVASDEVKTSSRMLKGVVVSDKMQKTRVVAVTRLVEHKKYGKRYKVTTKFKVHDENEKTKTGDIVSIYETRPISKDKRWAIR